MTVRVKPAFKITTFAALKHRNFRYYFFGQLFSLIGSWTQTTAQGYLVYTLTQSPAFLGYIGFVSGIPTWIFTLYSGVIADRVSRRMMMLVTQSFLMMFAFILAGLVFSNLIQPWMIVLLAFLSGIATAFDAPARQSFVVELVDKEDLSNAIALNASMFNLSMLLGPTFAGIIYALFGPGWCFLINGISFLAVIGALILVKLNSRTPVRKNLNMLSQIKEGIKYSLSNEIVRNIMFGIFFFSCFGMGLMSLIPAWSVDVLNGDVKTNGALMSARGGGAMIAALMIASLGSLHIKGRLWTIGSFVLPVALVVFSQIRWTPLSLALLVVYGWSHMMVLNTSNALIQTHIDDQYRGRVMSVYTLLLFGAVPIGSLLAGQMASFFGAPTAVLVNAIILSIVSILYFIFKPQVRHLE